MSPIFKHIVFCSLLIFGFESLAQTLDQGKAIFEISDFDQKELPVLEGEAYFFWDSLISPQGVSPSSGFLRSFPLRWDKVDERKYGRSFPDKGCASYQFDISLPANGEPYGLEVPDMYTSYALYANGKLIAQNGKVACSQQESKAFWSTTTCLLPDTTHIRFVLHISNYIHSKAGINEWIWVGPFDELRSRREQNIGASLFLTGALIMGGFFFLGMFLFQQSDLGILYFSLFCITYSYRIIGADFYFLHQMLPGLPFEITVRLEYLSLSLSIALFGWFILYIFPKECNIWLNKLLSWISIGYSILILFLPVYHFSSLIEIYFGCLLFFLLYGIYVYILAASRKRPGSVYALSSGLLLMAAFGVKMLDYFGIIPENQWLLIACYMGFFFLQSLILSYRFASNLSRAFVQANAASEAKSNFLATMSHEIRTPLNGVIGMADLLSKTELNKEQSKFVQVIENSGKFLLGIINDVLDFSRTQSNEFKLESRPFDPASLLEEMKMIFAARASQKGLSLDISHDFKEKIILLGDELRLKQVFANLINNAIKFTEVGGVKVSIQTLSSDTDQCTLKMNIEDTGIGIPEDKRQNLFTPFMQVDASINRRFGGSGLGLSIAQQIVKSMGGKIEFESEVNQGTNFTFTITFEREINNEDLKPKKLIAEDMSKRPISSYQALKIWVAEDNNVNQFLIKKILDKKQFPYRIFNNGQELVESIQQGLDADLILLDIQMPVMDGLSAFKAVKEEIKAKDAVVFAMTANVMPLDQQTYLDEGMDDLLSKPFKEDELIQLIQKYFSFSDS